MACACVSEGKVPSLYLSVMLCVAVGTATGAVDGIEMGVGPVELVKRMCCGCTVSGVVPVVLDGGVHPGQT